MNCTTAAPLDVQAILVCLLLGALFIALIDLLASSIKRDPGPPPPGFPRQ